MKKKRIIFLCLFCLLSFFMILIPNNSVHAVATPIGVDTGYDGGSPHVDINKSPFAKDGDEFYYHLEAGLPESEQAGRWNFLGQAGDSITIALNETIMFVNKIIFRINVTISNWIIGALDLASNFSFIDVAINEVADSVKDIVGINSDGLTEDGMFYSILKVVAILVVVYSFYMLVWRRSFSASFNELLKFVVVLVTSILLFTNYGSFLSGMNSLSNDIGKFIGGSPVGQSENTTTDKFTQFLWSHFVDDTYLTLQYGTTNVDLLGTGGLSGEERVRELLLAKPGSEARKEIVDTEINTRNNYHMTYESVSEKTHTNVVLLFLNIFTSIPILIIVMGVLFTHFWFIIISIVAPFALLIASFPSQFNVMKRYFFELSLPLMVKIGLHFMLIILMFLSDLISKTIDFIPSAFFKGQLGKAYLFLIFYGMLFFAVIILRKRIGNMLSAGSDIVNEIRAGMSSVTIEPVKKTVQTGVTVAGAVVGGAVGGAMGVSTGANIGATVGNVVTGESNGLAGATQDISRTVSQTKLLKLSKARKDSNFDPNSGSTNPITDSPVNSPVEKLTPEQKKMEEIKLAKFKENEQQGIANLDSFIDDKNIDSEQALQFRNALANKNIDFSRVNTLTLERYYDNNENFDPNEVASRIKQQQVLESNKVHELKQKRIDKFNSFLESQNLTTQEIDDINNHLESKAINVATLLKKDYEDVDSNIRKQLKQGKLIDYTEEFKKGIERKSKLRQIKEQSQRIMQASKYDTPQKNNDVPTARLE